MGADQSQRAERDQACRDAKGKGLSGQAGIEAGLAGDGACHAGHQADQDVDKGIAWRKIWPPRGEGPSKAAPQQQDD